MFAEKESIITNYVQNTLPGYLLTAELADFDRYVNDSVDLEKYKNNTLLFYNFGSYTETPLTNESGGAMFIFDIILVFRGSSADSLKTKMVKYADAVKQMLKDGDYTFGGAVDGISEVDTDFYNAAQGNPNIKVCQMTFSTIVEM